MVDVESLVEGLEYLVQISVSLSLPGVPIDGFWVGSRGGSEGDRWQVVDGEDSNADAGKEGGSPSGRIAEGWSEGHACRGGTDRQGGRVGRSRTNSADLTDRHTGCTERGDDGAKFIACGFKEGSGELRSAEVEGQSDNSASASWVVVQSAGS